MAVLTAKVQELEKLLDAQTFGNALYGLQKMRESQEVRQLVAALTESCTECDIELEGGQFWNPEIEESFKAEQGTHSGGGRERISVACRTLSSFFARDIKDFRIR